MHVFCSNSKSFLSIFMLQPQYSYNTMPKKGEKRAQAIGDDPNVELLPKMEIIYKDMKSVLGFQP